MNIGTVQSYDGRRGFGFIRPESGGKDIFVDIKALDRAGLGGLVAGQKIEFDRHRDDFGRATAGNLRLV